LYNQIIFSKAARTPRKTRSFN
jgi:hypothetical protein